MTDFNQATTGEQGESRPKNHQNRDITSLQHEIIGWRMEHPTRPLSECHRELKCSPSAVYNTTTNPRCKAIYDELVALTQTARCLSFQEKREALAEVVRSDITQFIDKDGKIELTGDNPSRRAVSEYEVIDDLVGPANDRRVTQRRKIKLISRLEAIDVDNKMLNLYRADTQVQVNAPTLHIHVDDPGSKAILGKMIEGRRGDPPAEKPCLP